MRCVHTIDKQYSMEFKDGTKVTEDNLKPQDEWPYSLPFAMGLKRDDPIGWREEMDTPDIEGTYLERRIYNLVIMAAEWQTNVNLFEARKNTIPIIRNRWSDKEHDDLFAKSNGALYYAWMPVPDFALNGVMVGNDDYHWGGKPGSNPLPTGGSEKIYDLQSTETHELFHLLGLTHDTNFPDHIMWPYYNAVRTPQRNDLFRLQSKYGRKIRSPLVDLIINRRIERGIKQ